MAAIIPVILCGGSGSRLWPASRESYPKQFLALGGDHSLFQDTLSRVRGGPFGKPIIITGSDYRFLVAEQARQLGVETDLVLEPMRRDSCAAIAAAPSCWCSRRTMPCRIRRHFSPMSRAVSRRRRPAGS